MFQTRDLTQLTINQCEGIFNHDLHCISNNKIVWKTKYNQTYTYTIKLYECNKPNRHAIL